LKLAARLRESPISSSPSSKTISLDQDLEDRYASLHRHCADQSSRLRLGRLLHRLNHRDPGVQESALAELELATQLIRVGARVIFLPESQARTADLECHLGRNRFFVEVTAMVGSAERRHLPLRNLVSEDGGAETDRGVILIHRILARISQKSKQLADYCDPVVLGISIPRADLKGARSRPNGDIRLDLKQLAGMITIQLQTLPHLTAVLITLWDVTPLPDQAATRLSNVVVAQRSRYQRGFPRVRLLVQNPSAAVALTEAQLESFRELL
jgi:hypothetical protein